MTNIYPQHHGSPNYLWLPKTLKPPRSLLEVNKMASRTVIPSVTTKTVPRPAPNGMGNGLFATADINPGDTVLHIEAPFVAILDTPRLEDTCAGCFGKRQMETGNELKACTGCRVVKYCDRVSRGDYIILIVYLD